MTATRTAISILCTLSLSQAMALDTFVGIGIGSNQNISKATFDNNTTPASMTINSGNDALIFSSFAGVKRYVSSYIMNSYQLDVGYDTLNNEMFTQMTPGSDADNAVITAKTGFYYGASTRFGLERGDYSVYLISGVRSGQWTVNVANKSSTANQGIPANSSKDFITTSVSLLTGLGVHLALTDRINGLFEYQYMLPSNYNKNTYSSNGDSIDWSTKLTSQNVTVSLIF